AGSQGIAGNEARYAGEPQPRFGGLQAGLGIRVANPAIHLDAELLFPLASERPAARLPEIGVDDAVEPRQIGGRRRLSLSSEVIRRADDDDPHVAELSRNHARVPGTPHPDRQVEAL